MSKYKSALAMLQMRTMNAESVLLRANGDHNSSLGRDSSPSPAAAFEAPVSFARVAAGMVVPVSESEAAGVGAPVLVWPAFV